MIPPRPAAPPLGAPSVEAAFQGGYTGQPVTPRYNLANFNAANQALNMSQQEKALYMQHLDAAASPQVVMGADGQRATLAPATVPRGGMQYSVPTVWQGRALDWNNPDHRDQIVDNVQQAGGWDKFPSYRTPQEAQQRYAAMQPFMAKDLGEPAVGSPVAAPPPAVLGILPGSPGAPAPAPATTAAPLKATPAIPATSPAPPSAVAMPATPAIPAAGAGALPLDKR